MCNEKQLEEAGVTRGMVRMSVGLEEVSVLMSLLMFMRTTYHIIVESIYTYYIYHTCIYMYYCHQVINILLRQKTSYLT